MLFWWHWYVVWWWTNLIWLISCWAVWDMVFAWDWQDTDLVGCFMNCKMSTPNAFAETIVHLRRLKKGSALLFLMQLFVLVISFLLISGNCGWTHYPRLLQLIQSILCRFRLLTFLIIKDSVSGWFLLHILHTQLQSSDLHLLHFPAKIIRVNQ